MALRLIEMIAPQSRTEALADLPESLELLGRWDDALDDDRVLVRLLVRAEQTESMLDFLQNRLSHVDDFRIMLLPVEATIPRPPEKRKPEKDGRKPSPERISREELYNDVAQGAKLSRVFVAQVILATFVASVGLMRNDTALLIGAMVIAPLLGPNMALCLATTLGDMSLAKKSLKANAVGLAIALAASLLIGSLFAFDADASAIKSRTQVSGGDIILALSAGCAGVLAFTAGAPSALIGVMVAVALLPPFTVFGLLLAAGDFDGAMGALLLVAANVVCVNLSGVLTFWAQGLRPRSWWEAKKATRATRIAMTLWTVLLLVLIALMLLASQL